jgi:hypothetical protein
MAKLATVWVWPGMGKADELWRGLDDESPEADSFDRTSMRVCAAFSREIRSEGISAHSSEIRFFANRGDLAEISVSIVERYYEGFESGRISVPADFHLLSSTVRAGLVSDAVEIGVTKLAQLRGWDAGAIVAAMDRVRASGYTYGWDGPWKLSPGRRHEVRLVAELMDDGYARIRAEIARASDHSSIFTKPILGGTSQQSLDRASKSLKWDGPDRFAFWNGARASAATIAEVDALTGDANLTIEPPVPLPNAGAEDASGLVVPRVVAEAPPDFRFTGGAGPTSDATNDYMEEWARIHAYISGDSSWTNWWKLTGARLVWAPVWFRGAKFKVVVRLTKSQLSAITYRPVDTIPSEASLAAGLARADIEELVSRVRQRFDLGEHPGIPGA